MGLAPWGTAGSGRFKSITPVEEKVSAALEKVAQEVGGSVTSVAIAYCLQRTPYVFPIVGGRKVEHHLDNIKALEITLSDKQIEYLESQTPFEPGSLHNLTGADPRRYGKTTNFMMAQEVNFAWVKYPSAIPASAKK